MKKVSGCKTVPAEPSVVLQPISRRLDGASFSVEEQLSFMTVTAGFAGFVR